jgi:acetylornithine deacetylase/succinyl-diaminopimelate desuccinylase
MSKEELLEKILDNYNEDEAVNLLADLIKIPSHKYSQYQESKIAEYIRDYFINENIEDVKIEYIEENRPNLIAKINGNGKKESLMFNGHLDTVPPYNMVIPAFEPVITENKISGRGAVDMKGSIAAMLTAMALIKRSDIKLKGDLFFTGVIDQEQRSVGSVDLVDKNIDVDYAVVGEPTNLKICNAHKGMEWIKIIIKGKSAHGSTPEKGINPIYHACRIASEIELLNKELEMRENDIMGNPTVNVGVISGGNDPNIVPSVCYIEVDRRYTTEEKREDIYEEIKRIITRLNAAYPAYQTEIISMDDRICPLKNIPLKTNEDNKLIKALKKGVKNSGLKDTEVTSFRGWSDAALFVNELNIPSVVFGPGLPEQCHAADESLEIEQLKKAVKVYLSLIIELCY